MARPKDSELPTKILAAAAREFSERGFAAASMAGIGARAGVTKGGVYLHFPAKEQLFFAVVDAWRSRLRAALTTGDTGGTGADALRDFLTAFLQHHFDDAPAAGAVRVLQAELASGFAAQARDDMRGVLRGLRARIRELLAVGAQDGSLFAPDPAGAAFLLAAAVEGVIQQWLVSPRDAGPFCHAETLAETLSALYATGAGSPAALPRTAAEDEFRPPF